MNPEVHYDLEWRNTWQPWRNWTQQMAWRDSWDDAYQPESGVYRVVSSLEETMQLGEDTTHLKFSRFDEEFLSEAFKVLPKLPELRWFGWTENADWGEFGRVEPFYPARGCNRYFELLFPPKAFRPLMATLQHSPKLETICLSGIHDHDVSLAEFAAFPKLQHIIAPWSTLFEEWEVRADCLRNVKEISIPSGMTCDPTFEFVAPLPSLEALDARDGIYEVFSGAVLNPDENGVQIVGRQTLDPLRHHPKLARLLLDGTPTECWIEMVNTLPALRYLSILRTAERDEELIGRLPLDRLTHLALGDNLIFPPPRMCDELLFEIARRSQLTWLSLAHARISEAALVMLLHMRSLRYLAAPISSLSADAESVLKERDDLKVEWVDW